VATILRFFLRLTVVAAGLVLAAGASFVFLLVLASWGLRAAWARLTGRAAPVGMRWRTAPFAGMASRAGGCAQPGSPMGRLRPVRADVSDVDARPVQDR
jgi:hypothetical protein